jgi:hypothetical protein
MPTRWTIRLAGLGLLGAGLAGCAGTSSSSGASEVVITDEDLQTVAGNLCAVKGHATNVGNLTIDVTIDYEARNATGAVIGTSRAAFRVAPFSNFDFAFGKLNNVGQPSSGPFSNNLACAGISDFKRTNVDVTH